MGRLRARLHMLAISGGRIALLERACCRAGQCRCVQMAKASGASTIIAVDLADKKLEGARSLGATHSINASGLSKGDVAAAVRVSQALAVPLVGDP